MALPATDAFTNSDGTALPTHNSSWTENSGSFAINTNAVYSDSAATGIARWNADSFSNDQYAEATCVAMAGGSGRIGVSVRIDTGGASSEYHFWGRDFSGGLRSLGKTVTGTNTDLDTDPNPLAINEVIRIEASGTSLSGKIDGVEVCAATDSSLTSGAAGLYSGNNSDSGKRLDDWVGGDLAAGGGTSVVSLAGEGGLAGYGGLAGQGGGLAG